MYTIPTKDQHALHVEGNIMFNAFAGKQINVVPTLSSQYQVVYLLVTSLTGAREISLMMFNAPGVNFALMNPVTYGDSTVFCVSVRVSSGSLHQLWHWLLVSSNDTLLECGTVGLALDGGTFLWLRDPATITQGQLVAPRTRLVSPVSIC
jgi:hypothetical protein